MFQGTYNVVLFPQTFSFFVKYVNLKITCFSFLVEVCDPKIPIKIPTKIILVSLIYVDSTGLSLRTIKFD